MPRFDVRNIRNLAVCGHGSAGKTTLVDRFLATTGAVDGHGSVDNGTSVCDFDPVEKAHGHTVEAKLVHFEYAGKRFQVLDTPGYPDFIGQTIGALAGVETAVIVVNAHAGIEVNTRRVFQEAGKAGLARVVVLDKLDDESADLPSQLAMLQEAWGSQCQLMNVPIGLGAELTAVVPTLGSEAPAEGAVIDPASVAEPLLESIIEVDEGVMERYFEGRMPTDDELDRLIVRSVVAGSLIPVFCCSGKTGVGVTELLDGLVRCAPSPVDLPHASSNGQGERTTLDPSADAPVVAQVFRTRIDPFVQKLSFIRLYSGSLHKDDAVATSSSRKPLKLSGLLEIQADKTHAVDEVGPGEIFAVAKVDELHTGTSLGDVELPAIPFPSPMVGLAVTPKTHGDEAKLAAALHKLAEEEPTLRMDRDAQTKELVLIGMSELHLAMVQEKLKHRDKLEIETKDPKIPFRETIQIPAEGSYRHKKQSGGRGQFGEVHIRMFPFPHGTDPEEFATKDRFPSMKEYRYDPAHNFLFVDSVVGGVIPGNYMPAIEKGFHERLVGGVVAGYVVQDLAIEVHFGKHHPVDSSEAAFKMAGKQAFKEVFLQAKPGLLEPVVTLEITVPDDHVGDVYGDMSGRGGRVSGSESVGGKMTVVHAEVPLREVSHYARSLSSMTGGMGSYTMDFGHYELMPANIQQEIVSQAQMAEDDDEE